MIFGILDAKFVNFQDDCLAISLCGGYAGYIFAGEYFDELDRFWAASGVVRFIK